MDATADVGEARWGSVHAAGYFAALDPVRGATLALGSQQPTPCNGYLTVVRCSTGRPKRAPMYLIGL